MMPSFEQLMHCVPFMALMSKDPPANRPLLTRLMEQSMVAVAAAAIAITGTIHHQNTHIEQLAGALISERSENTLLRKELHEAIEEIKGADNYPCKPVLKKGVKLRR